MLWICKLHLKNMSQNARGTLSSLSLPHSLLSPYQCDNAVFNPTLGGGQSGRRRRRTKEEKMEAICGRERWSAREDPLSAKWRRHLNPIAPIFHSTVDFRCGGRSFSGVSLGRFMLWVPRFLHWEAIRKVYTMIRDRFTGNIRVEDRREKVTNLRLSSPHAAF